MIRITSKRHNFRRCGIAHPKEPVDHPDDRFSKVELEILRAEPTLIVEEIEDLPGEIAPEDMTVAELKQELQGKEIPSNAKKAALVEMVKAERQADSAKALAATAGKDEKGEQ